MEQIIPYSHVLMTDPVARAARQDFFAMGRKPQILRADNGTQFMDRWRLVTIPPNLWPYGHNSFGISRDPPMVDLHSQMPVDLMNGLIRMESEEETRPPGSFIEFIHEMISQFVNAQQIYPLVN